MPITTDMSFIHSKTLDLRYVFCSLLPKNLADSQQKPKEEEKGSEFKETEIVYALSLGAEGEGCFKHGLRRCGTKPDPWG